MTLFEHYPYLCVYRESELCIHTWQAKFLVTLTLHAVHLWILKYVLKNHVSLQNYTERRLYELHNKNIKYQINKIHVT